MSYKQYYSNSSQHKLIYELGNQTSSILKFNKITFTVITGTQNFRYFLAYHSSNSNSVSSITTHKQYHSTHTVLSKALGLMLGKAMLENTSGKSTYL